MATVYTDCVAWSGSAELSTDFGCSLCGVFGVRVLGVVRNVVGLGDFRGFVCWAKLVPTAAAAPSQAATSTATVRGLQPSVSVCMCIRTTIAVYSRSDIWVNVCVFFKYHHIVAGFTIITRLLLLFGWFKLSSAFENNYGIRL